MAISFPEQELDGLSQRSGSMHSDMSLSDLGSEDDADFIKPGGVPDQGPVPPIRKVNREDFPEKNRRAMFQPRPSENPWGSLEPSGRREYEFGESTQPSELMGEASTSERARRNAMARSTRWNAMSPEAMRAQSDREVDRDDMRDATRPFRKVGAADAGQLAWNKNANPGLGNLNSFLRTKQQRDAFQSTITSNQQLIDKSRFGFGNLGNWFGGLFRNSGRRRAIAQAQAGLAGLPEEREGQEAALQSQVDLEQRLPMTSGTSRLFDSVSGRGLMKPLTAFDQKVLDQPFDMRWGGLSGSGGNAIAEADSADEDDEAPAPAAKPEAVAPQAAAAPAGPKPEAVDPFGALGVTGAARRRASVGMTPTTPLADSGPESNIPGMFDELNLDNALFEQHEHDAFNDPRSQPSKVNMQKLAKGMKPFTLFDVAKHQQSKLYGDRQAGLNAEKRVLNDNNELNTGNADIAENSGLMTVGGREVLPDNNMKTARVPGQEFMTKWRDLSTNQILQRSGRRGGGEYNTTPVGYSNSQQPGDYELTNPEKILNTPAEGWDNVGAKPGMFASKQAKADYRQRNEAATSIFDNAWQRMGQSGEGMPNYIRQSPAFAAKWQRNEARQHMFDRQINTGLAGLF